MRCFIGCTLYEEDVPGLARIKLANLPYKDYAVAPCEVPGADDQGCRLVVVVVFRRCVAVGPSARQRRR